MADTIKKMMAIADEMVAIMENERLVNQYSEVLSDGKKLAAYIVKTDEEMETLKAENKTLRVYATDNARLTKRNEYLEEQNNILSVSGKTKEMYVEDNRIFMAENERLRQNISRLVTETNVLRSCLHTEQCITRAIVPPEEWAKIRKSVLAEVGMRMEDYLAHENISQWGSVKQILKELGA